MQQNMVHMSGHAHDLNPNDERRYWLVGDPTTVSGVLDGNSVVRMATDGTVSVYAILKQPGGLPIQVERSYGHGTHAQAHAEAVAAELVHGRRARAVGQGLELNHLLPTLSLELKACTGLELVPMPTPYRSALEGLTTWKGAQ